MGKEAHGIRQGVSHEPQSLPKVLYICFDQSQDALVSTMFRPGIDLRPAMEAGRVNMTSVLHAAVRQGAALTTVQRGSHPG